MTAAGGSDTGGIAIVVKTPRRSPVKTRLAACIGQQRAEDFYRLSLKAIEATVTAFIRDRAPGWAACWAVAEADAVDDPAWSGLTSTYSGPGALGERLHRLYDTLRRRHGAACLLGGDSPQLTPEHLDAARRAATAEAVAIGPAHDGGFYLFLGSRSLPADVWTQTPYGGDDTLARLRARVAAAGADVADLVALTDADVADDLARLVAEMPADASPEQRRLVDWIVAEGLD